MLEAAFREELFPELRRLGFSEPGFESVPDDDEAPYRRAQRLFHFRQLLPEVGRVVLAVNIKPDARPTFDIYAGRVPEGGVRLLAPPEVVPADRVTASMIYRNQGHLQPAPGKEYAPFRQPLWAYLAGSERGIREAVHDAAGLLPELMEWLRTDRPTKHVRIVDHPTPRPRAE